MIKLKNGSQGFTLLGLLVVVIIIGILAAIALPQYKMAVTKAKVASILPLMRRWKDALQEYKLQHGDYNCHGETCPDGETSGVNWPTDWKDYGTNNSCGDSADCENDYWECYGEREFGDVICYHNTNDGFFFIDMYQPDEIEPGYEEFRGKIICFADGDEAHKICKALGGKLVEEGEGDYILY
ncbi:MAG: prepilin-type N-terminal cleavage/methylation domain-containing protein [Elusimicrobiaceae bacterium]|nr:prepilin-type N-terminal cleavage/methylation domain-containing protein [Elusimicrobiaceae bacterium]